MIECTDFNRLRKGQRVRKYYCSGMTRLYKDGTVEKGLYGDGFAYVRWDNEERLDMNISLYDVVLLKPEKGEAI